MFTSLLVIEDSHLRYVRGQEKLKTYSTAKSPESGNVMTNHFCIECGTLMSRTSAIYPGHNLLRLGTVDDFNLAEGKLKPTAEIYVKDRCSWVKGLEDEGVQKYDGALS